MGHISSHLLFLEPFALLLWRLRQRPISALLHLRIMEFGRADGPITIHPPLKNQRNPTPESCQLAEPVQGLNTDKVLPDSFTTNKLSVAILAQAILAPRATSSYRCLTFGFDDHVLQDPCSMVTP